ncbi:TetR/AcrR family transcriptional regulator [Kitasatospora sp. NPDC085879]|uniref:TetR/AcrR family transcriptional regulator n=1 Tax=Kitasatospora sp. NPDC085879 TaxID=3154769 RepID=UPI003428E785
MVNMSVPSSPAPVEGFPQLRRRTPVQARSRRTIEKILQAATEILVESGLPALNTNAIAARAKVNISSLYSYFPDKMAIVHELAARFEDVRGQFLVEQLGRFAEDGDWEELIDVSVNGLAKLRVDVPGGIDLRRALQAVPELRELDDRATRRSADFLAKAMCASVPDMEYDRAAVIALVIAETVSRLLDLAFRAEPYNEAVLEEVRVITRRYLLPYVTPES